MYYDGQQYGIRGIYIAVQWATCFLSCTCVSRCLKVGQA